jgi:hypothetical protein
MKNPKTKHQKKGMKGRYRLKRGVRYEEEKG